MGPKPIAFDLAGQPPLGCTVSWDRLLINLCRTRGLSRGLVSMVWFKRVLCKMGSDVHCMARKELRHDRDAVLLLTGHIRGIGTGAAKPNAKTRGTGSVILAARGCRRISSAQVWRQTDRMGAQVESELQPDNCGARSPGFDRAFD